METMETRVAQVAEYVRSYLYKMAETRKNEHIDPDYRWQHTLRVVNFGKQLAEAENANLEHVLVGCLLHDLAHFDDDDNYRDHGRLAARIARPFLLELGYAPADAEAICYAVAVHVDGEAGFEHENTLEAEIVSDADNIDRFSAYRTLLFCQPEIYDFRALAEKLSARLEVLRDYRGKRLMGTEVGHHLFNQKLDEQIKFYEAILAQQAISTLPNLSGM